VLLAVVTLLIAATHLPRWRPAIALAAWGKSLS
jgi:hypothetical protein